MTWGTKIIISFVLFGGFIIYLVFRTMTTHVELVSRDYYKEELEYQKIIDGKNNSNQLKGGVMLENTATHIRVQFPGTIPQKGSIHFYCPMDAGRDRQFSLVTNEQGVQEIDLNDVSPGRYIVKLKWESGGTPYYTELPYQKP